MAESPPAQVFLDSTIFLYHFTGASPECRGLLERCAAREVSALTSTLVLAEVGGQGLGRRPDGGGLRQVGGCGLGRRPDGGGLRQVGGCGLG
ncbi:MAG TPA: hypothetical protein VIH93_14850, partial [Thermoanaerobaculia bacterium]